MHQAPINIPEKCSGKLCSSCLKTKKINLSVLFCPLRRTTDENSFLQKKSHGTTSQRIQWHIWYIFTDFKQYMISACRGSWKYLMQARALHEGRASCERVHLTVDIHACTKQKRTNPTSRDVHAVRNGSSLMEWPISMLAQ